MNQPTTAEGLQLMLEVLILFAIWQVTRAIYYRVKEIRSRADEEN